MYSASSKQKPKIIIDKKHKFNAFFQSFDQKRIQISQDFFFFYQKNLRQIHLKLYNCLKIFFSHVGHRRDSERDEKNSDLPPRQRGRNDHRRVTDEDESVLDSHEVSSITSMDQGKY